MEAELETPQQLDSIEDVLRQTLRISPMVVASKPGNPEQVRICVDWRSANKPVMHIRHIRPTLAELLSGLNGAAMFS